MAVVAPKHETANRLLLDGVKFWHQLGKQLVAGLVEQGPPRFFASFGVNNTDAIRSSLGR